MGRQAQVTGAHPRSEQPHSHQPAGGREAAQWSIHRQTDERGVYVYAEGYSGLGAGTGRWRWVGFRTARSILG